MTRSAHPDATRGSARIMAIFLGAAGCIAGQTPLSMATPAAPTASATPCGNATPLYWYDPMRPAQHFDQPGKSPFMDMALTPKCAEPGTAAAARGSAHDPGSVVIDPRMIQTLGIRLARVDRQTMTRRLDAVGSVGVDEHRIEAIQVRASGWVEQLLVRAVGDAVHRGQPLAAVYSPDLLATQQEFLIARDSHDPELVEAARQRLMLFGMSNQQVTQLEASGQAQRRVVYYAPFDGYVMELGLRQGAAIQPGTTLIQLADLASVWVTADVPEIQSGWIAAGDGATVTATGLPGEHFDAKVDYLYPELGLATRTLKVRIAVKNPRGRLRPGMFAAVQLRAVELEHALTVPSDAVIKTGTRSVVILAEDATHFRPVTVHLGAEQDGRSQILDGLELGQSVVASGQFLVDSEAGLRGAFDHLEGAP